MKDIYVKYPNGKTFKYFNNLDIQRKMERELEKMFNKKDNVQTKPDYYTSKEFNFYDMIYHLKNNTDWQAKSGDKYYKYEDRLFEVGKYDGEWLVVNRPDITHELLHSKFKLIPPLKEEWVDIESNDILMMIVSDDIAEDIRVKTYTGDYLNISSSEIKMLTIRDILDFKWQQLKEVE